MLALGVRSAHQWSSLLGTLLILEAPLWDDRIPISKTLKCKQTPLWAVFRNRIIIIESVTAETMTKAVMWLQDAIVANLVKSKEKRKRRMSYHKQVGAMRTVTEFSRITTRSTRLSTTLTKLIETIMICLPRPTLTERWRSLSINLVNCRTHPATLRNYTNFWKKFRRITNSSRKI